MNEAVPQPASAPPVATVRKHRRLRIAWLLPLIALAIAGFAGWRAWGQSGPHINVRFSQGSGLRVGDVLRHRGITVGEVKKLVLTDDLTGVRVDLLLDGGARDLARAGSLFWIVRPKIGWSGIGGLDTLAGARYLDVLPGDGEPQTDFEGLDDTPITALCPIGGLEIIVQAPTRGGIRPGSQVTYRQLPVGRVVTTGLSSDAGMIEMRAYIDPPFTALVRERTCFWETSGVSFKLGLKDGVKLGFDSPEALLSGALALATPPNAGEPVTTGHRFALQSEAKDEWAAWQPGVAVGATIDGKQLPRPQATTIAFKRDSLLMRKRSHRGWTLPVRGGLLGPASLLRADKSAKDRSITIQVLGGNYLAATPPAWEERGIAVLPLALPQGTEAWPESRMRVPANPEECMLVGDPAAEPMAIAAARMAPAGDYWEIDRALAIDPSWHGAAVVARSDGALIGVFMLDGVKPIIAVLGAPERMFAAVNATVDGPSAPAP